MILVDTSVWISLLNDDLRPKVRGDDFLKFVTCGPIAREVTQGLRESEWTDSFRESFAGIHRLSDPLSFNMFLEAAEIYGHGRRKGYTIRSSLALV